MNEKMNFEPAVLEIILLENCDVITGSGSDEADV